MVCAGDVLLCRHGTAVDGHDIRRRAMGSTPPLLRFDPAPTHPSPALPSSHGRVLRSRTVPSLSARSSASPTRPDAHSPAWHRSGERRGLLRQPVCTARWQLSMAPARTARGTSRRGTGTWMAR
ncbi:hypothetical protein C8Q77DRAFT_1151591 [Trametes polyzona]|nr:hypothetical protein C8Q77DRAFT_1151591 [Trametes polyzona]